MFSRSEFPGSSVRSASSVLNKAILGKGSHARRRLGASLITLVLASPFVWSAPANARELSDRECLSLSPTDDWNGYWLFNFGGPNDAFFADGSPTIEGDFSSGLVLTWEFEDTKSAEDLTFYVEFFDDVECLNYVNPPEGVCVTFSATGWTPSADDSSAYDYYFDEPNGYTFEDLGIELGAAYEFDLSTVIGDETATAQGYYFIWSDGPTTGSDVSLSATLSACEDGSEEGGLSPFLDIDRKSFLNRAPADTGDLPDTL